MILLLLVLLLVFGLGGGYWGATNWGPGGGIGIFGIVLIVLVVYYLMHGRL